MLEVETEDRGPGWPEHKANLYFKNNQHKKSWWHGSSAGMAA
jgi:hypothetical protein